jgi:predicted MPP superfamily phosphohydrolase
LKPFRFLHISDLHLADSQRAETALGQLTEDLRTEQSVGHLDAIVVSGDCAKHATKEQFTLGRRLIERLRETFSVERERIVLVPGNHDVDWAVSRRAYAPVRRDEFSHLSPLSHWQESESTGYVEVVTDADLYERRFERFASFYEEVTGTAYPLAYANQWRLHCSADRQIVIMALNSSWNLDHHHPTRASVNANALNHALDRIGSDYREAAKIAVWHHPPGGRDAPLEDPSFIQRLVVHGFAVVLHGHVHKPIQEDYAFESQGRHLPVLGAGTLDADPTAGHPWQYNTITVADGYITVSSRTKSDRDGAWGAGGTFRVEPGLAPQSELRLRLPSDPPKGTLAKAPHEAVVASRVPPLRTLGALTGHLAEQGFQAAGYRIAVEALIFNANGEILLQLRGPDCRDEIGKLEGVGGQLDNDDLEACLQAHIHREIGPVRVEIEEILEARPVQFNERGKPEDWIVVSYLCRLIEGEPVAVNQGKTSELRWIPMPELHALPDNELSRSTSRARDLYWLKYRNRAYFSAGEAAA